jgi:hypothetical protein
VIKDLLILPEAENDIEEAYSWYEEQRAGMEGKY